MPLDQPDGATGAFGVLPGIVGAVQAAEAPKFVVGGPTLVGRVLLVDAWSMRFDEVTLTKDSDSDDAAYWIGDGPGSELARSLAESSSQCFGESHSGWYKRAEVLLH